MFNFKKTLKNLAGRNGLEVSRATDEASISEVAKLYHPISIPSKPLVRLGGRGDGGYLLSDDLDGIDFCLSPGVDVTSDFERDLLKRGIPSHLADYSVEGPPAGFTPASFTKAFIGPVSHKNFLSLSDWMFKIGVAKSDELLLQMDIEGAEYASILAAGEQVLKRFRIIILELHGLQSLRNREFFRVFRDFSSVLLKNHTVIHLHPNNCITPERIWSLEINPLLEVTLLRNDRFNPTEVTPYNIFPHKLDMPNLPGEPTVRLSPAWFDH